MDLKKNQKQIGRVFLLDVCFFEAMKQNGLEIIIQEYDASLSDTLTARTCKCMTMLMV